MKYKLRPIVTILPEYDTKNVLMCVVVLLIYGGYNAREASNSPFLHGIVERVADTCKSLFVRREKKNIYRQN